MSCNEIMERVTASCRFITRKIILVACKENYEGGSSWNIWCSSSSSFCRSWCHYFCVAAKVFGNIFHSKLEIYTVLGLSSRSAMVEVLMLCFVSLSFLLLFQIFSICDNAKNTELVPALYIFGDSTVDAGNNNNLSTTARANSLPYGIDFNHTATGRFTNGMTVADYFARFLGLPFAPPYMNLSELERRKTTTGLNFASAASGILPETGSFTGSPLTLDNQTDLFKMTAKTLDVQNIKMHLAKSIFFISTGSNDYIMNYRNIASKMNKLFSPDYFAKSLTEELVKHLKKLYLIGARKFVVTGLGPVGCIPAISRSTPHEGECAESINQALLSYNKELFMKLSKLQSQLHGSFFVHTDTFKFLQELKENKEKYGITDTQNACWEGKHDPCPVRDRYIYFDSAHPSQITNSIFASRCLNESSICTPMNIMQLVSAGVE